MSITSLLFMYSLRGGYYLLASYHQQCLFDTVKRHIKRTQLMAIEHTKPTTLTLTEEATLLQCMEDACTSLPLSVRYGMTLHYKGFLQDRIYFDPYGLLLGNGRFVLRHPRLPETHWILNHHARLRRATPHQIH